MATRNDDEVTYSEAVDAARDAVALRCPDDGACHHECPSLAQCFRVLCCGPLSGVYPNDEWSPDIRAAAMPDAASWSASTATGTKRKD